MSKETSTWYSHRVHRRVTLTRWGALGTPVLIFPTAAGDAEESERFHLIDAIGPLLETGRVKAYSVDSVPGQVWLQENNRIDHASWIQNQFDEVIAQEIVPAIRHDCNHAEGLQIVVTGASIGAFNALASICRHPDLFSTAICMSGTYDPRRFLSGEAGDEWFRASPVHFVKTLAEDSSQLQRLRKNFVLFTHGEGRHEAPQESWDAANVLGSRGVPNRVDSWGKDWHHDWVTWRAMLPKYLDELLPR